MRRPLLKGEKLERLALEMLDLLRELIDIEGPQPGTATWARKVTDLLARAEAPSPSFLAAQKRNVENRLRRTQVAELHRCGRTAQQISETTGIAKPKVYTDLQALGLKPHRPPQVVGHNEKAGRNASLVAAYHAGASVRVLQDDYGLCAERVRQIIHRARRHDAYVARSK